MFQYREAANFPWRSQAPQEAASPARFSSPNRLQAAGFPVFICPCITTACAATASADISLSLRGVARDVRFVTAHSRRSAALDIDWRSLARGGSTLAFYMGRDAAGEIMRNLTAAGMPGGMPVLIACDVSRPEEERLSTRLDLLDLATRAFAADTPTLIFVGAAVMPAGRSDGIGNGDRCRGERMTKPAARVSQPSSVAFPTACAARRPHARLSSGRTSRPVAS